MAKLKYINSIRRKIMGRLTKNVGKSQSVPAKDVKDLNSIKRILIIRPNHRLGNLLLITPLLQDVEASFPHSKIDILAKGGVSPILFKNYKTIETIVQLPRKPFKALLDYIKKVFCIKKQYDLVINVDCNSSSGRLFTKYSNAKYKVFGDVSEAVKLKYMDYKHIAKEPVYAFREFLELSGFKGCLDHLMPVLDIKLTPEELAKGKQLLRNIIKNDKQTICIFTFATGNKCYTTQWWSLFYNRLKKEYANTYNIVEVLPVENVSQIDFEAPIYYSKELREIAAFIANTVLFVGADSGMMHLASASKTPTAGLFSVTKIDKYSPYGNKSLSIDTNTTTMEEWITTINEML